MRCQECGNDRAIYNEEMQSAALCADCASDYLDNPCEPYDYQNERTVQENCAGECWY